MTGLGANHCFSRSGSVQQRQMLWAEAVISRVNCNVVSLIKILQIAGKLVEPVQAALPDFALPGEPALRFD